MDALVDDPLYPPMDYYANRGGIWTNYTQASFVQVQGEDGTGKSKSVNLVAMEPDKGVPKGGLGLGRDDEEEDEED